MPTAYQHRPLSKILVQEADTDGQEKSADAPSATEQDNTQDALPEKYRGKTAAQIAEMHSNAERELGRTRNEVGTLRGLVSDLSSLQRQAPESQQPKQEEVELSGDDLIRDPVGSMRKVVQNELRPIQAKSEQDALEAKISAETKALETQFGDYSQTVLSEEFQNFANRTSSRQYDLSVAAHGNGLEQVRAARRLLEDFNDFTESTQAKDVPAEETPVQRAKKVATESGRNSAPVSSKPKIYESDVIALINSDAAKYRSPSYQKELTEAIKDGRFVKNT